MSQYKIKPILHYHLIIKNKQDQNNFFRKRQTLSRVFKAKSAEGENYFRQSEDTRKCRSGFLRLISTLKCVKAAHVQDSQVFNTLSYYHDDGKQLYMIKKMRQVRTLSLKDISVKAISAKRRNLGCVSWLKFAKKLKSIVYLISTWYFERTEDSFRRKLKRLSTWFNRVKLRRLEIIDRCVGKENFLYHEYPKSLACLRLDIEGNPMTRNTDKELISSKFANLTNLKKLSLNLEVSESSMASLLNSVSDLPQLTVLDLEMKKFTDTMASKITPFLYNVRRLQQLTSLRLFIHVWSTTLEPLFDAFKDCPITAFSLKGAPYTSDKDDLGYLSNFLSGLKNLTSLEINIKNFKNIHKNTHISAECLLPILREVLSKPVPLTSFSLIWNRFDAQKVFPELISLLTRIVQGLKEVRISIGKYQPDDKQFKEMIQFLRNLTVIHTLELCNMNISGSRSLEKIANIVCCYKNIRVLTIGKVLKPKPRQKLVESVGRIISKRGMETFGCDIGMIYTFPTWRKKIRNIDYIDLESVCLKNPYLEPWLLKYLIK